MLSDQTFLKLKYLKNETQEKDCIPIFVKQTHNFEALETPLQIFFCNMTSKMFSGGGCISRVHDVCHDYNACMQVIWRK